MIGKTFGFIKSLFTKSDDSEVRLPKPIMVDSLQFQHTTQYDDFGLIRDEDIDDEIHAIYSTVSASGYVQDCADDLFSSGNNVFSNARFPGYAVLAQTSTKSLISSIIEKFASEMTREWVDVVVSDGGTSDAASKIPFIKKALEKFEVRKICHDAIVNDCRFGKGIIYVSVEDSQLSHSIEDVSGSVSIGVGTLLGFKILPNSRVFAGPYDTTNVLNKHFNSPTHWSVDGEHVHTSKVMNVIRVEVDDLLKPQFNFSGLSLTQLISKSVSAWEAANRAVVNLLVNYSTTVFKTDMSQVLYEQTDGRSSYGSTQSLRNRISAFTSSRSNMGTAVLDRDTEELLQSSISIGGVADVLDKLLNQIGPTAGIPSHIVTGEAPSGLGSSAEGEQASFYDTIKGLQRKMLDSPLRKINHLIQQHLYGEIDDSIVITFNTLDQPSKEEASRAKLLDIQGDVMLVQAGAISPEELRDKVGSDAKYGFDNVNCD